MSRLSLVLVLALPAALGAAEPPLIEARLADGSAVKLLLLTDSIDVSTKFGKLTIPVQDLRRIEFGLRYPDGVYQRIVEAVGRLGHSDFKTREAAQAELMGYRELAYPLIVTATRSSSAEAARRARLILDSLREKIPEERLLLKPFDSIQTGEFPIHGRIETASFKARSSIFGETVLKLADLRALRSLSSQSEVRLTIEAARHGMPQEQWLETEIEVAGMPLEIRADGRVDLYPFGGERGMYIASPDGSRPGGQPTLFPSGALLGKIGPTGRPFLIGKKYDAAPVGEGKLFLRIESSPWRVVPTGHYSVTINGGR